MYVALHYCIHDLGVLINPVSLSLVYSLNTTHVKKCSRLFRRIFVCFFVKVSYHCSELLPFFSHPSQTTSKQNPTVLVFCSSLPCLQILQPKDSTDPIRTSPLLCLMAYIYQVELNSCWSPLIGTGKNRFLDDKVELGELWENVLAAYGDGIRVCFQSFLYLEVRLSYSSFFFSFYVY